MKKVTYNINELLKLQEFDVTVTIRKFRDHQEYFNKLTVFVEEAKNYLKEYNPLVVISSDEEYKRFVRDLDRIRLTLGILGIEGSYIEVGQLADAAKKKEAKILEDGILKFQCDMEILSKRILDTRIEDASKKDAVKTGDSGPMVEETVENYLEAILLIKNKQGHVRAIDVANHMNYAKAAISVVMKRFRGEGYILMDLGGYISLTEKGMGIAVRTYERHTLLKEILVKLGVDEATANQDAGKMKHVISEESFSCVREYYRKVTG